MDEQQRRLAEELLFSETKKASFAKKLYFGMLNAEQVFPFPRVSSEEKARTAAFLSQVVAFADREIDPVAIDRNAAIPDAVIAGLGKLGVSASPFPPDGGPWHVAIRLLQNDRGDCQKVRLNGPLSQCPAKHRIESAPSLRDRRLARRVAETSRQRREIRGVCPDRAQRRFRCQRDRNARRLRSCRKRCIASMAASSGSPAVRSRTS